MTNWKKDVTAITVNEHARRAYERMIGTRSRLSALHRSMRTKMNLRDVSAEEAAEDKAAIDKAAAVCNAAQAEANEAAETALRVILPMLDDEQRVIYDARIKRSTRTLLGAGGALIPAEQWCILQDNDQFALFTENEWDNGCKDEDLNPEGVLPEDAYEFEMNIGDKVIARYDPEPIAVEYGLRANDEKRPGHNIRKIREQNGTSITELARRAALSRTMLSQIENGAASLYKSSLTTVQRIADALHVSIEELLK